MDDGAHYTPTPLERRKYETARRVVSESEYGAGPVMVPGACGMGEWDGWFCDTAALRDYCDDEELPLPEWVFGGYWQRLKMDAGWIVEREMEDEWPESAWEAVGKDDIARLQAMLDEWCESLSSTVSRGEINYGTVVRLEQEGEK